MKKEITRKNFFPFRDDFIVKLCSNKKILHIGACDSPYSKEKFENKTLLHPKIEKVAKEQIGIDLDKKSISYLKKKGINNITYFDMNKIEQLNFEPEVIIFGETIEHIMNLEIALTNLKKIMSKNTKLIITTPNADFIYRTFNCFKGIEIQHPDHNVIFSYKTLEQLMGKNNLKVINKKFTFTNRNKASIKFKILFHIGKLFPMFSSTLIFVVKKNEKS